MTPPHPTSAQPSPQPPWRQLVTAVALLPRGLCALAAVGAGRVGAAGRWLRTEAEVSVAGANSAAQARTSPSGSPPPPPPPAPPRGAPRLAAHALLTVLLGALAWVLAGVAVLAVVRGLFYGFVDDGPYDDSWGGPSRGGAWLAHFAAGTPFAFAAAGLLYGVGALQLRLTAPLRGGRRARWVLPVVLVSGAAGALFVVAWLRQLD